MARPESADNGDRLERVLTGVQIPLENIEFTIESYLLENGCRLDPETRLLLARVRDSVGRVAASTRRLSEEDLAARGAAAGHAGWRAA